MAYSGEKSALAVQSSEAGRAFGDTFGHIHRRVESPRFFPQLSCFRYLSCVVFEDLQPSDGVRKIQRRGTIVAAIEGEPFILTGLGEYHATCIPMDVTQMSHRVRQRERVVLVATDGDGLLVR